jgi:hypothetical protein
MNNLIEDLAAKAKVYAQEQFGHTMNPMLFSAAVFQKKFAELIVRECIAAALSNDDPLTASDIADKFGVE